MKLVSTGGMEPLYSGAQTINPVADSTSCAASMNDGMEGFDLSNTAV